MRNHAQVSPRRLTNGILSNLSLAAAIASVSLSACAAPVDVPAGGPYSTEQQKLDPDEDQVVDDNCPTVANAPDEEIGIACMVREDCVQGPVVEGVRPTHYSTGALIPLENGKPMLVWCLTGQCKRQRNSDRTDGGDACDGDDDNDRLLDTVDNCPLTPNPKQENNESDALGDICDPDDDNDGVCDPGESGMGCMGSDNCPMNANPMQQNADSASGDAAGDACDPDRDGDMKPNDSDNCPDVANPGQENNDGDAQGDTCDADDDNDTVADGIDNCAFTANSNQTNTDMALNAATGDALGDACDPDDDNDQVCDPMQSGVGCSGSDNCQAVANPDQRDTDGDFAGDSCDADDDGDSVLDAADNCPPYANPAHAAAFDCNRDGDTTDVNLGENAGAQCDLDGDGIGNPCDTDCDNDGFTEVSVSALPNRCSSDIDDDGFEEPADCNEGNDLVHPGAAELCNGVDDDCSGTVDQGGNALCASGLVCNGVRGCEQCTATVACPSGQTCQNGSCVQTPNTGCSSDANCSNGQICVNSVCAVAQCSAQLACPSGETCQSGRCVPQSGCSSDANCSNGQICVQNACVAPQCSAQLACPSGQTCQSGRCVAPPPQCVNDAGCPNGQYCASGTCHVPVDIHGQTPANASGANGGPNGDTTRDDQDNDGDGACEGPMACTWSADPARRVQDLVTGDCDDNPNDDPGSRRTLGSAPNQFVTDGSFANRPGNQSWCGYDNDCDGDPREGCSP